MKLIMASVATMMAAVSCGQKKEAPKVLVLYYSQTSNTKAVAQEIADALGADMEEIVAVQPYDGDFQATIQRCMQEREGGILPEIQPLKADVATYDIVFLGYPVWFGTYAPPVITLLNQIDLAGKKVVPFCTFGSGGLDSSVKELAKQQPEAEILPGYGVRAARMQAMPAEVDQFLKASGFLEGEYVQLDEFPEPHEACKEESAIFNAAVGDYPMINAEARTVTSRPVPGGVEYRFTAQSLPRADMPAAPPASEMTVYVLALEGKAPEFTQVLR